MATIDLLVTEYIYILDALAEGEIEGVVGGDAGVYFNDVPLINSEGSANIKGAHTQYRTGTADQGHIDGIPSSSSVIGVNSQIIDKGWTDTDLDHVYPEVPAIVTINERTDSVALALDWQQGLFYTSNDEPIPYTYTVAFSFDYRTASNQTWRLLTAGGGEPQKIPWGDIAHSEAIRVGQSVTDNYVGLIRDLTYGAELTIIWDRPDINENNTTYAGQWVKVKVEYKIHGTATWTEHATKTINISDCVTTNNATPDQFSELLYYYWTIDIATEGSYDYRVSFLDADVVTSGPSYTYVKFNSRAKIAILSYDNPATLTGMVQSQFKKYFIFNLLEEEKDDLPIDIKVYRVTKDDGEAKFEKPDKTRYSSFKLATMETITNEKLSYPHTALVGLKFAATSYSQLPARSYDVKLLKIEIPDNYDPLARTYTGLWAGAFKVAWSNNPAWAFHDIIMKDRYGMGQFLAAENINKWVLYEIGMFCDELVSDGYGGQEPRYTVNTYIQRQEEALVLIRNLASIFRGMVYWLDNKITCSYDHPADPVCEFTNANVVDGLFTYSGSSKDTRYNTVRVAWNDPRNKYKVAIEVVEDDRVIINEIRSHDLTALGCTSRGQARRQGKAFLATETEVVVFTSSLDNVSAKPGDLVNIYDRYKSNVKLSGRILNYEPIAETVDTKIYLDSAVVIESETIYTLNIITNTSQVYTKPDGSEKITNLPIIDTFAFTSSKYSKVDNSIEIADLDTTRYPCNTVYTIFEANLQPQLFRIISITEDELDLFTINAMEFNQTKQQWVDDIGDMDYPITIADPVSLYALEEVTIQESIKNGNNTISINWGRSVNAGVGGYTVEYKYYESDWILLDNSVQASYIDLPIEFASGMYQARVQAVLHNGATLAYVESLPTEVVGADTLPGDITGFTYTIISNVLRLSWDASSDFDISHYEVQNSSIWGSTSNIIYASIPLNTFDVLNDFTENYTVKAVDTRGNYSLNAAHIAVNSERPQITNILGNFTTAGYKISWTNVPGAYPLAYVLVGSSDVEVSNQLGSTYETTDLAYWSDILAPTQHVYTLIPYDVTGASGDAVDFITLLPNTTITNIYADTPYNDSRISITCQWNTSTFPIKNMEYYIDDVYQRNISTEAFVDTMLSSGSFKIGLKPVDLADRVGTLSEYTITVTNDNIIILDETIRMDSTIPDNMAFESNRLTAPVILTETWADHFSLRGYTNVQDQINAGYPNYTIPDTGTITYSEIYSTTELWVANSKFTVSPTGGGGSLVIELFTRNLAGAWLQATLTETTAESTVFSANTNVDEVRVDYIFTENNGMAYTLADARIIGEGL